MALDYSILVTQTNMVLAGDSTAFVVSSVKLSGTNNILESAVVKATGNRLTR